MATSNSATGNVRPGEVHFSVHDKGRPVEGATCSLYRVPDEVRAAKGYAPAKWTPAREHWVESAVSGANGQGRFTKQLPPGHCLVVCHHAPSPAPEPVEVESGCAHEACIDVGLNAAIAEPKMHRDDCTPITCGQPREGDLVDFRIEYTNYGNLKLGVQHPSGARVDPNNPLASRWTIPSAGRHQPLFTVFLPYVAGTGAPAQAGDARIELSTTVDANERTPLPVSGQIGVALSRTATAPTTDTAFFRALLNSTEGLSFNSYLHFMDNLFCGEPLPPEMPKFEKDRFGERVNPAPGTKHLQYRALRPLRLLPFTDSDAYRVVKAATEAFVMVNCGVLAEPQPFDDARDDAYLRQRDLPVPAQGLKQVFGADYLVSIVGAGQKTLPYLAVIRSKLPDIAIKLTRTEAVSGMVSPHDR